MVIAIILPSHNNINKHNNNSENPLSSCRTDGGKSNRGYIFVLVDLVHDRGRRDPS